MKKVLQNLKVIRNIQLNPDHYLLELLAPEKLPEILPGQFVEVLIDNSKNTFLRRPFSIHNVDYAENTISLLIKRVGEGTRMLGYLEKGDFLNVIYPLGNGFSLPEYDKVLLIAGGIGIAPLLYMAKYLYGKELAHSILIGGKSKQDILRLDEYKKYGKVYITTEDGSLGEKGVVTNHSILKVNNKNFKKIYACGPEPMLKAVARYAEDNNIDCEISLENTMACGIGACLCCVAETTEGNRCVCTDGPVFNLSELKW